MDTAPWIQTASGNRVDLLAPTPDQISIIDVARALSRIPRFNGHTDLGSPAWNVADHSLLVDLLLQREGAAPELCLFGLLHDAHEFATGDITSPMQTAIRLMTRDALQEGVLPRIREIDPVKIIQAGLQHAVHIACGLPEPTEAEHAAIKRADVLALSTEKHALMTQPPPFPWMALPPPAAECLMPRQAEASARAFLQRFEDLNRMVRMARAMAEGNEVDAAEFVAPARHQVRLTDADIVPPDAKDQRSGLRFGSERLVPRDAA